MKRMKRARILYDRLREDKAEKTLFERMSDKCPSFYGMSEFRKCKLKCTGVSDPYECLQCWMCKERNDESY